MNSSLQNTDLTFTLLAVWLFLTFYYIGVILREKNVLWKRVDKIKRQVSFSERLAPPSRHLSWLDKIQFFKVREKVLQASKDMAKRYRLRFEKAGWDPQDALIMVSLANGGLILLSIFLSLFVTFKVSWIAEQSFILKMFVFFFIMFSALRGFEYFIDFTVARRYDRIRQGLPYAIDLMNICSRSGFGLERSFEKIAEEMSQYNPDLCQELTKTAIELSLFPDRDQALRNMAERLDLPIVQILVSGLIQAGEQGAPLSNTLRMMSAEFSKQKLLEIEEKATKLPALLTLPLVLFLLPALLIVLLGPAIAGLISSGFFS